MHTETIIARERARLALIGSRKDPALFQVQRQMRGGPNTMNRTVIVNFADESTTFGCRFACSFCSWRDKATETGDIYPTKEALACFLDGYSGYKVTVSGGGDPLYKAEQNHGRLGQLVDWIHELGFLVEVVTKETAVVAAALGEGARMSDATTVIRKIDCYSLSYENRGVSALAQVRAISAERLVRVSKVCTPGFSARAPVEATPYIASYCEAFLKTGAYQVVLREDFYDKRISAKDAADRRMTSALPSAI